MIIDTTNKFLDVNKSFVMLIDASSFCELTSINNNNLNFNFYVTLKLDGKSADVYEKIQLTAFNKLISSSDIRSKNEVSSEKVSEEAVSFVSIPQEQPRPIYSSAVERKLYHKFNLDDEVDTGVLIASSEVFLAKYLLNLESRKVTTTVLEEIPNNQRVIVRNQTDEVVRSMSLLNYVNCEQVDPTSPAAYNYTSTTNNFSRNTTKLLEDYFINVIRRVSNPQDVGKAYRKRLATVKTFSVDLVLNLKVPKQNSEKIVAKFDLFEKGKNIPIESIEMPIDVRQLTSAYKRDIIEPSVTQKKKSTSSSDKTVSITISDQDRRGTIESFNVYKKSIDPYGKVSNYIAIASVKNTGDVSIDVPCVENLSIIRAIPVIDNEEANVYGSVVVGRGYEDFGSLTISTLFTDKKVFINVDSIPMNCTRIDFYKRDVTSRSKNYSYLATRLIQNIEKKLDIKTLSIQDSYVPGRTFDYIAIAKTLDVNNVKNSKDCSSNHLTFEHPTISNFNKNVTVTIENATAMNEGVGQSLSFVIKTSIDKELKEKLTLSIKEKAGELYEQYLNPTNNSKSPLGNDLQNYSNLFFHQVVRINSTTSERETFNIVTDGTFYDNAENRKINNVKPLSANCDYTYQIYTGLKDPVTMFPNHVTLYKDSFGKEVYYKTYKWRQNSVKSQGILCEEDSNGNTLIDFNNLAMAENLGITAVYQFSKTNSSSNLLNINVDRIDVNTSLLTWNYVNSEAEDFDSFVVIKVVNDARKILGRTCKQYMYHSLSTDDMGSVQYVVVPIKKDFSIDNEGYSNVIFYSVESLTNTVKHPQ